MYRISNFADNDDVKVLSELGAFQVIEYQRDLSVTPGSAITAYSSAQLNVKKRQLVCHLNRANVTVRQELCSGCLETSMPLPGSRV